MEEISAHDHLEIIGWGKYNRNVFLQCGFASAASMFWSINIVYVLVGLKDEFSLSVPNLGILGSCFPIGLLIGMIIFGIIGERHGQVQAFKLSVFFSTLFSLCLIFTSDSLIAGLLLFLLGACIGGELSLAIKVFYEFCPPSNLDYLFGMVLFWSAGLVLSALFGLIIVLTNDIINSWRIALKLGLVIEIFCMIFRVYLDDTPVFCESSGQIFKLKNVLNQICIDNTGREYKYSIKNGGYRQDENKNLIGVESSDLKITVKKFILENFELIYYFCLSYFLVALVFVCFIFFIPKYLGDISNNIAYCVILMPQFLGIPGVLLGSSMVEKILDSKEKLLHYFVFVEIFTLLTIVLIYILSIITETYFVGMNELGLVFNIYSESYLRFIRNFGDIPVYYLNKLKEKIFLEFYQKLMIINENFKIIVEISGILLVIAGLTKVLLKVIKFQIGKKHN